MLQILTDPEVVYSLAPQKSMVWANEMHRIGLLKNAPSGWKGLFFPIAYDLSGN